MKQQQRPLVEEHIPPELSSQQFQAGAVVAGHHEEHGAQHLKQIVLQLRLGTPLPVLADEVGHEIYGEGHHFKGAGLVPLGLLPAQGQKAQGRQDSQHTGDGHGQIPGGKELRKGGTQNPHAC